MMSNSTGQFIYLDHAATSPLLPEVKSAMLQAMDFSGNASALHTAGHLAHNAIEEARLEIAKLINAEPDEIIFTSGGSEANNTVVNIFAGQNITTSSIEHPSVLESVAARAHAHQLLPIDRYGFVKDDFTLSPGTAFVSVMLANNEIGTIQDLKSIAKIAHQQGALIHSDATQALGKIPLDVKKLGVDYLTISAHKIGGPIGIGALYVKKGSSFKPLIMGGHQERGRRAGTYPTVNIVGFGAAAQHARQSLKLYTSRVKPLRDRLSRRILQEIPYSSSNTPLEFADRILPNLLNVSFAAAEGESIQLYLDAEKGIVVSTGSACASGDGRPSHVLMALKNDAEVAHSSIRFSLSPGTTAADIDAVMSVLPGIVRRLQQISTVKIKQENL